jgi:hypothetical protein
MKGRITLLLTLAFVWQGFGQVISDLDWVSPMHEGYAAVKKGNMWGFIDNDGVVKIEPRGDLVSSKMSAEGVAEGEMEYPVFIEGRCLVEQTFDGIRYFGFIDSSGKTIVEPGYVNATNFRNGFAIVTQYSKQVLGKNELLGKEVVNYQLEELIIDKKGEVVTALMNARTYVPNKIKGSPPDMNAYFLGERLVAVKGEDGKWSIFQF